MKTLLFLFTLLFSFNLYSQVPGAIAEYFDFVRNADGKLIRVDIKQQNGLENNNIYTKNLDLLTETLHASVLINNQSNYMDWPEELLETKEEIESLNIYDHQMSRLYDQDIKDIFNKLISKLKNAEVNRVVAKPYSSRYFYKNKIEKEIKDIAYSALASLIKQPPILNAAYFLVNDFIKQYHQRRKYHQNMLLFYLSNLNPNALGLNPEEIMLIKSSIWESKISVLDKKESDRASSDWLNYGLLKEEKAQNIADKKLDKLVVKHKDAFRYNLAFIEVADNEGISIVWNLLVDRNLFSKKASTAIDFNDFKANKKYRRYLKGLQFAARLVSVPDILDSAFDHFIESFYYDQINYEGALLGHYLIHKDNAMVEVLIHQSLNFALKRDFFN